MKTILPTSPLPFNEWCKYVRQCNVDAQLSAEAQLEIGANAFVQKVKDQLKQTIKSK